MRFIPRRTFLMSLLAAPLACAAGAPRPHATRAGGASFVPAEHDRFGRRRNVFGSLPIDRKVTSDDTGGGLFVIEQVDDHKGGPPRHVHPKQDEWFHVVAGRYVIEVGEERFELAAGDSILAPRGVPHAWAHTGEGNGRLWIAFQPAGRMEAFFDAATKLDGIPSGPDLARLFREHDMEVLGPPLAVDV